MNNMVNSYFNALVYLRDDALAPLQLVLRRILLTASAAESTGADIATVIKQIFMALVGKTPEETIEYLTMWFRRVYGEL